MTRTAEDRAIVVLGAGLAGLGFAREIPTARIFEAKPHPGGHAYSHETAGVAFDEGAHISHTQDAEFRALINNAAGRVHDGQARSVRNYWQGHWTGYPIQNNLRDLPADLRVRALTDLVLAATQPAQPSNYREWCLANYGSFLTDEFYEVFTTKYWRRDATDLATDWLSGRLIPSDLENIIRGAIGDDVADQSKFSSFQYPESGGFFGFFEQLYTDLDLSLGRAATEIDLNRSRLSFASGPDEHFEILASSIPLPALIDAIKDVPQSVKEAAKKLRHTKLRCVNLIVAGAELTDSPWCYIYDHEIDAARVSFPGTLAPASIPAGTTAIQAEVFRDALEPWGDRDVLAERTVSQMANLFGFDPAHDLRAVDVVDCSHAYVVSDHNRASAAAHILDWLETNNVYSMGLYGRWKYLWSDGAYRSGYETARNLKAAHGIG